MITAVHIGCDARLVGMFFLISVGIQGLIPCSSLVIPLDLSPNYAGSIAAFTNGIALSAGFIVPIIVGLLTPNVRDSDVFLLFSC